MTINGCDISFYQDDITTPKVTDFVKMHSQANFVIIRVGQNLWVDRDFKANWTRAKAAGIPRGSYWLYDSRVAPEVQANLWADALGSDLGELPLFADLEEGYNGAWKDPANWQKFILQLQKRVGKKEIGIYTGFYYFKDSPMTAALRNWFGQFPLWIANYGVVKPNLPAPWTTWLFWQNTDKGDGLAHGVESLNIDMDVFNGTQAQFNTRFGLSEETPLPSPAHVLELISVKNAAGIVPEIMTVDLTVDGTHYTLIKDQRPVDVPDDQEPNPEFPHLYRVKDDIEAGIVPNGVRPYLRNGVPCTVLINGGKGTVRLSPEWMAYVYAINKPKVNYQFENSKTFKKSVGWHNQGDPNVIEQITFGGNIVEAIGRTENGQLILRCVYNNIVPSAYKTLPPAGQVLPQGVLHPLAQLLTTQYPLPNGLDISTNSRFPRTLIIANPGEVLTIDERDLVRL